MKWVLCAVAIVAAMVWSALEADGIGTAAEPPAPPAAGVPTSLLDDRTADAILARLERAAERGATQR